MEVLIRDDLGLHADHAALRGMAGFALEAEGAPGSTELSIAVVSGEEMARLNEKYLGREGPTDVLSFYLGDRAGEAYVLGDVVVCPREAERRAGIYGVGPGDEVLLALVHGILHLMGYDDEDEEGNLEMDARQRSLLEEWKKL